MRFLCRHIWLLLPVLAAAGCGHVAPTKETVKRAAVEIVERGLSIDTGLRGISSDQPVDPSVSPSGRDLQLGLVLQVPLTAPVPRDPLPEHKKELKRIQQKIEAARIGEIVPKYKPAAPKLQLDPIRRIVNARKHELRELAVEVVRSEPLFWLEDGAADALAVQIQITEPEILTEPGGAVRWSAGRYAITVDLVGESIAAADPSLDPRYGVMGATLTASDSAGRPERELTILVDRAVMRNYVRDGHSLRPLPAIVFHGPTVLARTRSQQAERWRTE